MRAHAPRKPGARLPCDLRPRLQIVAPANPGDRDAFARAFELKRRAFRRPRRIAVWRLDGDGAAHLRSLDAAIEIDGDIIWRLRDPAPCSNVHFSLRVDFAIDREAALLGLGIVARRVKMKEPVEEIGRAHV